MKTEAMEHMMEMAKHEYGDAVLGLYPRRIVCPDGFMDPKYFSMCAALFAMSIARRQEYVTTQTDKVIVATANSLMLYNMPTYFVDPSFFAAAVSTVPPENYPFSEIRFPMPSMLLVFPQSVVRSSFGFNCPFVAVAKMEQGEHRRHPVFSKWANIGCEAEMVTFAFPLITSKGAFVWYSGFFPYRGDISVLRASEFGFEDDKEVIRTYLLEKRQWTEEKLDRAMKEFGEEMTEEQDKELLEKVESAAIKVIMASTSRSDYVSSTSLMRKVKMRRDGTVEKEELWSPAFIGRGYKIRCETVPGDGTHASPRMHWRKGHWHHVVHGPQRSLRRLDWFEPTLVNPN